MRRLILHGAVRRWTTRLHRWCGLVVAACLLVAAVTGTWLVFRVELDRIVNPHLRLVAPAGQQVSLARIVDFVEARYPRASVGTLILPERPDDSIGVYLRPKNREALDVDQVFVNPYTGAILGARSTSRLVFSKEYLDPMIDRLHYSLWMSGTGLWIMGLVAGVWMLTSAIGLALAWPHMWRRMRGWMPILSARAGRGAYKASYEYHRAIGVWLLPVLMLLAFTSFYQNLPQFVRPVVGVFSPLAERPRGRVLTAGEAMVSPDQAIASLEARFADARPSSIGRDIRNARYAILFHLPNDLSPLGDNWAYVDLGTGAVTDLKIAERSSAGDKFLTWIFPLHTGTAFGTPGRVLIAIGGLGLTALIVTGFYVWWIKWRMRRRAQGRPARRRALRGVVRSAGALSSSP